MTPLELALEWVARGVPALPVMLTTNDNGERIKRPATPNGHKDATTDPEKLRSMFASSRANGVGLHPGPAGYIVVDIDCKGSHDGFDTAVGLDLPDTFTVVTPSGGEHRWFRKHDDVHIGNLSAPGIDIRADAGWVVAPGTNTPWGNWETTSEWSEVVHLPGRCLEALRGGAPKPTTEMDDIDRVFAGSPTGQVEAVLGRWFLHADEGRHPGALESITRLLRLHERQHPGVPEALDIICTDFLRRVTGDKSRTLAGAEQEWSDMLRDAGKLVASTPATAPVHIPTTEADEVTSTSNLPEAFWERRQALHKIRQAAHSRLCSADAVLGAVLARVAALTPPTVTLPAIIGNRASLNVIHGIVASSGGGKSAAVGVAAELLPWPMGDHLETLPPGSGEGLVEAFHGVVTVDGKREKRQTRDRLLMYLDEGQALAELGARKGATLLPVLRTAWFGQLLGNANASVDTRRVLNAHTYRLAVIIGVQLEHAAPILADVAGGTPQRFAWFNAMDPGVPETSPEWPATIEVSPPPPGEMDVHPDIRNELQAHRIGVVRGEIAVEEIDAHHNLVKLKLAALLAILDERRTVNTDDWQLAGMIWATSCVVRSNIEATAKRTQHQQEVAFTQRQVRTQHAVADSVERRSLEGMAKAIARRTHRSGEPVTRRELHGATKAAWRQHATLDEAIALASDNGWIASSGDRYIPGKSRPS